MTSIQSTTFAKSICQVLWNKTARSSTAAVVVERECKLQPIRPVDTRWNSDFLSVERILRIIRESGEGAVRAVTIALKVPVSYRRGQPTSWDVGLVMEVKKLFAGAGC